MEARENNTLSFQIHRQIGLRILVCIILYLFFFFSITAYDFYRGLMQEGIRINKTSYQLNEYIISQILMKNQGSIHEKLKETASNNNIKIGWEKNKKTLQKGIKWSFPFGWIYKRNISTLDGRGYGILVFTGSFLSDKDFMFEMFIRIFLLVLFLVFMLLVLYPLSLRIPKVLFIDPLFNLLSLLNKPESYKKDSALSMETDELQQIEKLVLSLIEKTKQDSRNAAVGQVVSQVAHDIRSPLAALNVLREQGNGMKKEEKLILQNSINRINDIANNLLINSENEMLDHFKESMEYIKNGFIYPSINSILIEKKLEISVRTKVSVKISSKFYMAYSMINKPFFNRIISNVINNSEESLPEGGYIDIQLSTDLKYNIISIKDSGYGMTNEVKEKIFDYGYSYGKDNGSGLGLAYAKKKINGWGGEIEVESELGSGTEIVMKIPIIKPPDWVADNINIIEESIIVIVDDDAFIHDIWEQRIKKESVQCGVKGRIVHLYSPSEFRLWHIKRDENECYHFLIDFEFISDINGLDLIKEFDIGETSYLVTSKYDDETINDECRKKMIKLIHKDIVQYINIQFCAINPALILIDNDINLGEAWKYKAAFTENKMVFFDNISQFMKLKKYFSILTPIYIDSDLNDVKPGEQYAKSIYELGFKEIYLATGIPENMKKKPSWIKKIVTKDPPF